MLVHDKNYHEIVRKLISDNRKVSLGSNFQNLPSRGAGNRVRNCIVPREGFTFIGADLGQIEPRIMSHIMYTKYGDNSMRQIFVDDVDLYTTMAMMTFGLAEEYCVDKAYDPTGTFKPRAMMKTGQLAVSYDQSPKSFAKKMNVTDDVARMFFENFDRTFPSFKQMVADSREFMRKNGYVETLFGRKRRFPEYKPVAAEVKKNEQCLIKLYTERKRLQSKSPKSPSEMRKLGSVLEKIDELSKKRGLVGYWERASFNAIIQGTGADILKMIGNRVARVCKEHGWEFNASIHDEIKVSVPNDQVTPETIAFIDEVMTETATFSVPLVTDVVIEPRWMQEYKPSEWDFKRRAPIVPKYDGRGEKYKDFELRLKAAKGGNE